MLKPSFKYNKQKGFTLTGWIVVIVIFLYFAYLAMIITPYLVSNNTMNRILESLKEEPGITQKSKRDIWRLIENRMMVNQVRDIKKENFDIEKGNNTVTVYLEYDDKIKFMNHVYIVIERNKSVELVRN
jgi:1,4-dihydroxy-2-naphthoate octaprenyltransferase